MDYNELVKEYEEFLRVSADNLGTIPHCDMFILHSRGVCEYCDLRPELQTWREAHHMQFTDQAYDPDEHDHVCPALKERPLERIERWGGNVSK